MASFYGMGVKRKTGLLVRLTPQERKELSKRARGEALSRVEYARRKMFDLPLPSFEQHNRRDKINGSIKSADAGASAIPPE